MEEYEIVDGFYCYELGKGKVVLKRCLKGYLLIMCLDRECYECMVVIIWYNCVCGCYQIYVMLEIVCEFFLLGWDESKIGQELGMDVDEVLCLKQINGLQEFFVDC